MEKLKQLLVRVNGTRERLAKVPAILKRFRQAVLASACSGRLTEDWRTTSVHREDARELFPLIEQARHLQEIRSEKNAAHKSLNSVVQPQQISDSESGDLP